MSDITCKHCGQIFEEQQNYCPSCKTPTPEQQELDLNAIKRKFIYFVIAILIFCAIMIVWLPRGSAFYLAVPDGRFAAGSGH